MRVVISDTVKGEMVEMLASSVQPSTVKSYNAHFKAWAIFLKHEVDLDVQYMRGVSEGHNTFLVSLMMLKKVRPGIGEEGYWLYCRPKGEDVSARE